MSIPAEAHEHFYKYGGVKYELGALDMFSDNGNRKIIYYDWFYCTKCAGSIYRKYPDARDYSTSVGIMYNATPKTE